MGAALSEVRRSLDGEERKFWSPRAREELYLFLYLVSQSRGKIRRVIQNRRYSGAHGKYSHPLHLGSEHIESAFLSGPRFLSLSKQTNMTSVPLKQECV